MNGCVMEEERVYHESIVSTSDHAEKLFEIPKPKSAAKGPA